MSENEWRQGRPTDERWVRRRTARVVPMPEHEVGEGTALAIVIVSATIAVVVSALTTTLF